MKHINLHTGCTRVNLPFNISVSVYRHQPPPAQGPYLTSIRSSCAPRCPRGKCSLTLMRWKMSYRRCTEKYERQEVCLGVCHFDRLRSFAEPAHCPWAKQKAGMTLARAAKPCRTALTPFVLCRFCSFIAATRWS